MTEIKFGTDGWRGLIADDFTFENIRSVSGAIASYLQRYEDPKAGAVVGYDTRFYSQRAARLAAEVLANAGIPVWLAGDYTPTPAISFAIKNLGAAGGIVITSSHNPWNWNGLKFKGKFGGSGTPAMMRAIESELRTTAIPRGRTAPIRELDLKSSYTEAICKFADMELIAGAGFKFAVDSMHGSARGVLAGIFRGHEIEHIAIRQELNPLFPGINPEPIEPHITKLQETVVKERCHAGFATDGDGDRIGAVAEDGSFVDAHKIFAIVLHWLLERKRWPGEIARTFNSSRMVDRIASCYGRRMHECPIGFKYIADLMMDREILIGGEESGGIGYGSFLPERDGVLNSLLLANVMAEERKPLGELVAALQRDYGPHFYRRRDLHVSEEIKQGAIQRAAATKRLVSYGIDRRENLDGVKLFLAAPNHSDGAEAWILFRASGTEPLLRIYAEAASQELVDEILAGGVDLAMERT
ncbi:MAG: phosphoglucomutase/phosphomannomutase family protein [Acidobacteriales bacterium]|nr:phosphoglucomutase/phosphomannomutase family protein [Terriglobales bacterium]